MMLTVPPGDFRAYLLDCDGTIANSMPLHYLAWQQALAEWGSDFPEELFYSWGGRPATAIIEALNERAGLAMPAGLVTQRKESLYRELLPDLTAVPEVVAHIEEAYGRIPLAVVSGGTRESVTASLTTLGLIGKFELMVCAGDYTRGKPDPEAFLLAAERLGVPPRACLVFEDSETGIRAAAAAGMASVRVAQPGPARPPATA
jgi:HAD superfamily hydrolase (TIGR01509 family)